MKWKMCNSKKRSISSLWIWASVWLTLILLITGCGNQKSPELLKPVQSTGDTCQALQHTVKVSSEESSGSLWQFSHGLLAESLAEKNPILSPVSAYLAMGMTGLGAAGDTLAEFQAVMGTDLHQISQDLMQNLPTEPEAAKDSNKASGLHIRLANSVWVDQAMEPLEGWLNGVNNIYNAKAFRAQLSSKDAMQQMNKWIEDETLGLIKKFLEEPLDEDARMALFNTVYFYGEWHQKFKESNTYPDTFIKEDGQEVQVDMMHDYQCYRQYVAGDDFDGVILPYRDGDMAFVALKPTAGQPVRELYENLTEEVFQDIMSVEETTYMNLKLPKLEVTFDTVLNEKLQNMGIESAFDENLADFSALGRCSDGLGVYISLVRQKAVMKLDEEGTEAAAVTMVVLEEESAAVERQEKPLEVFFDEPFLYMIVNTAEEVPLFMGIMDQPEVCQ